MRKLPVLALACLLGGAALAQINLNTGSRFETTDCAAGGSSIGTTLANSKYLLRVTGEDTFICWAASCAAGGEKFPTGTIILLQFQTAQALSCRSTGATGDVIMTKAN